MTPGPGVWITGPSRSGTSLTAGIFAAHGVFFGDTVPGDEHNPKGYFEHPALISRVEGGLMADWPGAWWDTLRAEGLGEGGYWGAKRGPQAWPWIRLLRPAVIVVCKRPLSQILRSRKRRWPGRVAAKRTVKRAEAQIRQIEAEAACPVVTVNTDAIVKGDFFRLNLAFDILDLWLSPAMTEQWIDRGIWNRGPASDA